MYVRRIPDVFSTSYAFTFFLVLFAFSYFFLFLVFCLSFASLYQISFQFFFIDLSIKLNGTSLKWCLLRRYLRRKLWGWLQASSYLFGLHLSLAVSMSQPEGPFICFFSAHILRFHSVWARSWTDWGSGLRSGESASGSRVPTAYTKWQTQGISLPFPSKKKMFTVVVLSLVIPYGSNCFKCQYLNL